MSDLATTVALAVIGTLAALVGAVLALRNAAGGTRRARRHDALRTVAKVNEGGHVTDLGTIKIDVSRWNRPNRY